MNFLAKVETLLTETWTELPARELLDWNLLENRQHMDQRLTFSKTL